MRFRMHNSIALLCLRVEQKDQPISPRTLNFLCGAFNMANKLTKQKIYETKRRKINKSQNKINKNKITTQQSKINNKSQNLSFPSLLFSISIFPFSLHFYFCHFYILLFISFPPFIYSSSFRFSFPSPVLLRPFFSFPLIPNFSTHEIFFSPQFFSTPDFLSLSLSLSRSFIH